MERLVGDGFEAPPEVRDRVEFHWWHVPVGGALLLCVLSQCPVWYVGHFHGGRMRPCERTGCELCGIGVGRQIRYIICAAEVTTRRVGALEVGPGPGMVLRDHAQSNGGLRGTIVEVRRATKSKHSRLDLVIMDEHPGSGLLSLEPLDLHEVLGSTWTRQAG